MPDETRNTWVICRDCSLRLKAWTVPEGYRLKQHHARGTRDVCTGHNRFDHRRDQNQEPS